MLVSKNLKDGKCDDLKSFKNQKLENHFKTGLEIIILKSKGKSLRGGGTWLKNDMPKKWLCKLETNRSGSKVE